MVKTRKTSQSAKKKSLAKRSSVQKGDNHTSIPGKRTKTNSTLTGKEPLGTRPDSVNPEDEMGYEIVSPPPMRGPYSSFSWWRLTIKLGFLVIILGGLFVFWPFWSPYVASYIPVLRYSSVSDTEFNKLTERILVLENRIQFASDQNKSISEMEYERARLQRGVKKIFERIKSMEVALEEVKIMSAKAGVQMDQVKAQRIFDELTERLRLLEKNDGTVDGLMGRLERLESLDTENIVHKLKTAEEKNTRLNSVVSKLQARLRKVESSKLGSKKNSRLPAMVVAVSQLRKSVLSGKPFAKDFGSLHALLTSEDGMKAPLLVLEKHSKFGVLTLSTLRARFSEIVSEIVVVSTSRAKPNSWHERIYSQVLSLVSVRRVDGKAEKQSIDTYISNIEKALEQSNLDSVLHSTKQLVRAFPSVSVIVQPWLSAVKARLLAERAVTSLHVYAVTLIAQSRE